MKGNFHKVLRTTGAVSVGLAMFLSGAGAALADSSVGTNISTSSSGTITSNGLLTGQVTGGIALYLSGAPAASATSSLMELGPVIAGGSVNGTYIGINPAAFTGNFMDLQVAGTSKFKVSNAGVATALGFSGPLTGDVTGNVSGNAGTVTNGVYTSSKVSALSSTTSAELAGVVSNETGSGVLVYNNAPNLMNLTIGSTTAAVNDDHFVFSVATGGGAAYTATFSSPDLTADRTINFQNASGTVALTSDIPSIAGLAASGANSDITSLTGLTTALSAAQGGTGITSLGSGVATFLGTASSANLKSALSDETGSGGGAVFANTPTLMNPLVDSTTQAVNDDHLQLSVATGGAGAFTGTLSMADLTAGRSWALPNADGTLALAGSFAASGANADITSLNTVGTTSTAFTFEGAGAVYSNTSSTLTLDSTGTGTVNLGVSDHNKTIHIGDAGATSKLITLGSTASASALTLQAGSGNMALNSLGTLTLDAAGVLELNSSGGAISIGNDAVAQNINIGTAAARTITIGSTAATLLLNAGASNISLTGSLVQQNGTPVASTASMTLGSGNVFVISGTADITSITTSAPEAGKTVTLIFSGTFGVAGVVDGGNLKLASTLAYTPDDTLTLVSDGTNWYEVARSVN
ncbi:MAG: hypothetical protein WCJ29_03295 [bacterium]